MAPASSTWADTSWGEPEWVVAHLDPLDGAQPRGASFEDPAGFCLFSFKTEPVLTSIFLRIFIPKTRF